MLVATKDGRFIQTSTMLPHQGRALSEVAGIADCLDDPRFSRLPTFDTAEHAQEWEDLLQAAFRAHDLDHWLPKLLASPDVAFEVAVTSEEGLDHPQIIHNGDVITISDPALGLVREVGPIAHFSETPMTPRRSAPAVGANDGRFAAPRPVTGGGETPPYPFAGVTIVEFGYFYAMPYGTAMAAALGARVIKIEDADGDPHRRSFGPDVATNKTTAGKESLSVDLRTAEGRALAQRLVASADVFATGFRSGIADKHGLGYDELRRLNPRLVYVHAAGYGTDGPYAHRALYAQAAQTVAGSFGRQVGYWSAPERNADMSLLELQAVVLPRLGQVVDGDSNAALAVLAALALGIYHQQRTGHGQFVRTSMIAGNAWAYADDFCSYRGKPPALVSDDEYWGVCALDRLYPAAEGWVCLVVRTEREWQALTDAIGSPELATNPRFATAEARQANDGELIRILGARFAEQPSAAWEELLSQADVGCVDVGFQGHPGFISFDQGLRETGLTTEVEHPQDSPMVVWAPPPGASRRPPSRLVARLRTRRAQPRCTGRGSATPAAEIGQLEDSGVIVPHMVPAR